MSDFEPVLLAAWGDTHFGGTVGLMSPAPVLLDNGGSFHPSTEVNGQLWKWWLAWWERVERERERIVDRYGSCKLVTLCNGDLFEGDHHQTHEIVSRHRGSEFQIARPCWDVPLALGLDRIFITRGTAAHGGQGAKAEEGFAKSLAEAGHPIEPNPDLPHLYTAYHWYLDMGPWRVWATHHGSMGHTPRTKASLVALRAGDVTLQAVLDNWRREGMGEEGEPIPDLFIGSHYHQFADSSANMFPTAWVQLPCWTYSNEHAQKVAARTLPEIGGVLVSALPDRRRIDWEPVLFKPRRATPCRI